MNLRELVRSDLHRFVETFALRKQPYSRRRVLFESLVFKAGFQAVFLYRLSHWCHQRELNYAAWALARMNVFLTGCEIEFNANIGPGLCIAHPVGIVIGRGTTIGANATIFQGVSFGVKDWDPDNIRSFPSVGDNCFFFAGCAVFGPVRIGNNCIVGGHSVVLSDVPDDALAVGLPMKLHLGKGGQSIRKWKEKSRCAG